jgi:hypothetical protein
MWLSLSRSGERLWRWWRQWLRRNPASTFHRPGYSAYERFLHYAADFLFPRYVQRFDAVSDLLGITRSEYTPVESRIFWHILKLRRILIVDKRGHIYRHIRIRSIQDIQKCIPPEWFNRYFRQYQV